MIYVDGTCIEAICLKKYSRHVCKMDEDAFESRWEDVLDRKETDDKESTYYPEKPLPAVDRLLQNDLNAPIALPRRHLISHTHKSERCLPTTTINHEPPFPQSPGKGERPRTANYLHAWHVQWQHP